MAFGQASGGAPEATSINPDNLLNYENWLRGSGAGPNAGEGVRAAEDPQLAGVESLNLKIDAALGKEHYDQAKLALDATFSGVGTVGGPVGDGIASVMV
jgi:hypothetical protein